MKSISVQSRIASSVIAVAILLQVSPSLAGAPDGRLANTQGSVFPGFPAPSRETARDRHHGPVDISFTKWITTFPLMSGFTGSDVPGHFVGEILQRQVSSDLRIIRLEAIYEVQAEDRSFTALLRGGTGGAKSGEQASVVGAALLDGVILTGWRTGSHVHVAFQTTANCPGAPDGRTCFQGTIHVERASEE
jgi:hypothetical protein